jgi:hypothetical protein
MPSSGGLTGSQRSVVSHMRIAPVAGQHRQQHRPQNVPIARRVRAAEIQPATRDPAVKQSTLFQVFNEEWKLAKRRYPRPVVPFDMDTPRKGVRDRCLGRHPLNCRLLTRRENRKHPSIRRNTSRYQLLHPIRISPTLESRLKASRPMASASQRTMPESVGYRKRSIEY